MDMVGRTVVVGAGIGGLVAAIDLAHAGLDVLVVEGAERPGGKLREETVGECAIDVGPTVLTMRWVFDGLFADAGRDFATAVPTKRATSLARHAWGDGTTLELFADRQRAADAVGDFAGAREARGYLAFCEHARRIYEVVERPFLRSARPSPFALLGEGVGSFLRIDAFRTMWRALGDFFRDHRLRQLFGRYATYCGSSPFEAPATLNLIAHVEQEGVVLVDGGMYRLVDALVALLVALGGRIRCGSPASRIVVERGRVAGVELADGERVDARAVVFNGDVATLAGGKLGPLGRAFGRIAPRERSLSALTWAVEGAAEGFPLARHNVFFSDDYRAEFDDLFERRALPLRPTVYLCAQDRDDAGRVATTRERFFLIVNAPPTGDEASSLTTTEIERCEASTFEWLERCGARLKAVTRKRTAPADFERSFPFTGGAIYGRASHGMMSALGRPEARTSIPGLYLAGGSVHPGPGVPMAALSGRIAASTLLADSISTARRRPGATAGSTWTR